jgi:hypothetical protein
MHPYQHCMANTATPAATRETASITQRLTCEDQGAGLLDGGAAEGGEVDDGADEGEQQRHQDEAPQEAHSVLRLPDVLVGLIVLQSSVQGASVHTSLAFAGSCQPTLLHGSWCQTCQQG